MPNVFSRVHKTQNHLFLNSVQLIYKYPMNDLYIHTFLHDMVLNGRNGLKEEAKALIRKEYIVSYNLIRKRQSQVLK